MTQKRAALRCLVALHLGKTRLDRRLQRTDPVWVSCPFPDITNEIVKAPRIWFERINGCRCRKAINTGVHLGKPALPDIAGRDICVIRLCRTPRKANIPLTGPRGVFPFGLGREPPTSPSCIRSGVVPRHVHHRVIGLASLLGVGTIWCKPACPMNPPPPLSLSNAFGLPNAFGDLSPEHKRPTKAFSLSDIAGV